MHKIELDARPWASEADLIEAVIAGLQGPVWHGQNYNALHDSMVTGSINEIDAPFSIVIAGTEGVSAEVADAISYFIDRVTEWARSEGVEISAVRAAVA